MYQGLWATNTEQGGKSTHTEGLFTQELRKGDFRTVTSQTLFLLALAYVLRHLYSQADPSFHLHQAPCLASPSPLLHATVPTAPPACNDLSCLLSQLHSHLPLKTA